MSHALRLAPPSARSDKIARVLRPNAKLPCRIIESNKTFSDLKLQLRGYKILASEDDEAPSKFDEITGDLYGILRGKSHLVFANSRNLTEQIAISLSDQCEKECVPNEFFPHHGNLSKDIRESLRRGFKRRTSPPLPYVR